MQEKSKKKVPVYQMTPSSAVEVDGRVCVVEKVDAIEEGGPGGKGRFQVLFRDLENHKTSQQTLDGITAFDEVSGKEHTLAYLYLEDERYMFLDQDTLETVSLSEEVVQEKRFYLKSGTLVTGSVYQEVIASIELPTFMEMSVSSVGEALPDEDKRYIVLETGAKILAPCFVEVGDVIKVDTEDHEFVQRI